METVSNTVVCGKCLVMIEFDDDGTVDCMPDGAIEDGKWYCDDCCYETGIFKVDDSDQYFDDLREILIAAESLSEETAPIT